MGTRWIVNALVGGYEDIIACAWLVAGETPKAAVERVVTETGQFQMPAFIDDTCALGRLVPDARGFEYLSHDDVRWTVAAFDETADFQRL